MTGAQRRTQIVGFIRAHSSEHGYPPTVREIAAAIGLASSAHVHEHLVLLERQGVLRRDPTKPRAITLCDDADQLAIAQEDAARLYDALTLARGFLGMSIRSPNCAAFVADEALAAHDCLTSGSAA